MIERRTFVKGSAMGLLAAAMPWVRVPRLAWADSGELYELAARPPNYESPRETFTSRITPIERFYIRNHFDTPHDEALGAAAWRLRVHGLCGRELSLSLADLRKMKQTTVEAVLQCAGNGRGLFVPQIPGVQWRHGAMGNAQWTGVRLHDVLALSQPAREVRHLQLAGADRPTVDKTPRFIRGIPIEKAMHADTLIALAMNGKPLSPLHGAPARLVVPGWVGDDWVKWIEDIELRADEAKGFYYETGYRFPEPPRAAEQPVPPEQMKPMTRMNVKSIVGSLSDGQRLAVGTHELKGVAFSGEARITRVDVTVDGGVTFQPARLEADSAYGFRVFHLPWTAKAPGRFRIGARATDSKGATQPLEAVWNPSGYLHNAVDFVTVEVGA